MELDSSTLGLLLVVAIVLAAVAIAVAGVALVGQRRVRTAYRAFAGRDGRLSDDVLMLLREHVDEVRGLRDDVRTQRRFGEELRALIGACVSRVATLRYDAFDDMGGRLSFSSALLDEAGNGVVLTSINGRAETRTYAKPVVAGESRHNLSDEESQVIHQALSGGRAEEVRPRRNGPRVVRDAS